MIPRVRVVDVLPVGVKERLPRALLFARKRALARSGQISGRLSTLAVALTATNCLFSGSRTHGSALLALASYPLFNGLQAPEAPS